MNNGIVCFFDGSCGPTNPGGNMGLGAVIYIDGQIYKSLSLTVPAGYLNSNNVAEYRSFIWILNELMHDKLNGRIIYIYGDSMLVVKQMTGKWRLKKGYYLEDAKLAKRLLYYFKNTIISWIPRAENEYADNLSKNKIPV